MMMQQLADLIHDLKTQSHGYRFGELWQFWPYWVIALIRSDAPPRQYSVLPEVKDKIRFQDSGSIRKTYATGISKPVLVLSGSSFGSYNTQSRGVEHNVLISPYEQKKISVKCINAPHPVTAGENLVYDSILSKKIRYASRKRSQSEVWNTVNDNISHNYKTLNDAFTTDPYRRQDYVHHAERRRNKRSRFSDFIKQFPMFQDQIGIILIHDTKGVEGMEVFSHPDAYKHQYKDIIESYAHEIDEQSIDFTKTPNEIMIQIHTFLDYISKAEELHLHDSVHTSEVRAGKYTGELTRYKGDIIYCFFCEGEKNGR